MQARSAGPQARIFESVSVPRRGRKIVCVGPVAAQRSRGLRVGRAAHTRMPGGGGNSFQGRARSGRVSGEWGVPACVPGGSVAAPGAPAGRLTACMGCTRAWACCLTSSSASSHWRSAGRTVESDACPDERGRRPQRGGRSGWLLTHPAAGRELDVLAAGHLRRAPARRSRRSHAAAADRTRSSLRRRRRTELVLVDGAQLEVDVFVDAAHDDLGFGVVGGLGGRRGVGDRRADGAGTGAGRSGRIGSDGTGWF